MNPADDRDERVIQGFTSRTSVLANESIDFFVSTEPACDFSIKIYRLGHYAGLGARLMASSPTLRGAAQALPKIDETTGEIRCEWSASWTLLVPKDWQSGLYLAVFKTRRGRQSYSPFVVRSDRPATFCVFLPFATYQAYNQWPKDGVRGKSLYYGYIDNQARREGDADHRFVDPPAPQFQLSYEKRARVVSFDRPYAADGIPTRFMYDHDFICWVERMGYDVTYADSMDLHSGTVNPNQYASLIFCGHDEYWSANMREMAKRARDNGVGLAFMTANNIYWHVAIECAGDGRPNRKIICYKSDEDPQADPGSSTNQWRAGHPAPAQPEQELIGVQYNGVVAATAPLVVQNADHWFWDGSGVKNGDLVAGLVKGEADGFDSDQPAPKAATYALLSASPYPRPSGRRMVQNTSLYEMDDGTVVFAAGTLEWPAALGTSPWPYRRNREDRRVQVATANVLNRMRDRQRREPAEA